MNAREFARPNFPGFFFLQRRSTGWFNVSNGIRVHGAAALPAAPEAAGFVVYSKLCDSSIVPAVQNIY